MNEENIPQDTQENSEDLDTQNTEDNGSELVEVTVDELTALKKRADLMGIKYHPNIGLDSLREKVNLALHKGKVEATFTDVVDLPKPVINEKDMTGATPEEIIEGYLREQESIKLTPAMQRNAAIKDANKLIRIRVTCMNPNKREWVGEVLTVSNSIVGTFKKYVPFNLVDGWHVPQIILHALRERKCQVFVNGVDEMGRRVKRATQISEFGIEILDPLTPSELKELGQRQLMASGAQ